MTESMGERLLAEQIKQARLPVPLRDSSKAGAVMKERDLLAEVRALAGSMGWPLVYHTHDSRRSEPGFPDLVMIRGNRLLAVELKSDKGTLTDAQRAWLAAFADVRKVESMVVRPGADYSELIEVLR